MSQAPRVLDIEALLAPISAAAPGGSHEVSELYSKLRAARETARNAERAAIASGTEAPTSNWKSVFDAALGVLTREAKDGDAGAWLIEAALRLHGFAGLRDGLQALTGLVDGYWAVMRPAPDDDEDDDEADARLAKFAGLVGVENEGALISAIRSVPFHADCGVGLGVYLQAIGLEAVTDATERDNRLAQGVVPMEAVRGAVTGLDPSALQQAAATVRGSIDATDALDRTVGELLPDSKAPSLQPLRAVLSEVLRALEDVSGGRVTAGVPEVAAEAAAETEAPAGDTPRASAAAPAPSGAPAGPIRSREEAFARLQEVAAYFRSAEPQSVLAWQIEECVRWGRMDLPALLRDLMPDESARHELYRRIGVPRSVDGEDDS